jgi:hypothetical protein
VSREVLTAHDRHQGAGTHEQFAHAREASENDDVARQLCSEPRVAQTNRVFASYSPVRI